MGLHDTGMPDLPDGADVALVGAVLRRVQADLAGGVAFPEAVERARDAALAHRPAMPLPRLEEAVSLAQLLACAGDRVPGRGLTGTGTA